MLVVTASDLSVKLPLWALLSLLCCWVSMFPDLFSCV